MSSKYDLYWEKRKPDLAFAIQAAAEGKPATIDCTTIKPSGERGMWDGKADVRNREVLGARRAHRASLGSVVAHLGLCASHPQRTFAFSMNMYCQMRVTSSG